MKREEIIGLLQNIEKEENIEIIYACEAGSRVWGFAREDSDYDIRFIYRKNDVKDYLTLKNLKNVIEYCGDDFDMVGWDIKKALNLHLKDNPSLREWLISKEVYIDKGIEHVFEDLGGFDKNILKNHYSAIAYNHWKRYSSLQFSNKKIKKYLHIIRAILCWNILNSGYYPPISIQDLLNNSNNNISSDLKLDIYRLIDYYQGNGELSEEIIFRLNNFIINCLNNMKKVETERLKDVNDYDERFRELLLIC